MTEEEKSTWDTAREMADEAFDTAKEMRSEAAGKADDQARRERVILAVGNTVGIARVDDQIEVVTPEPEPPRFHTVVPGESLSVIARKYCGDAMKYPVIFEANKPMLSDTDKLYPGQVLHIPPVE